MHQAEKGDPIHQQVKGDCEACILATIGGDQQMMKDLYICANSRGRPDRRGQPICHMIEGWLDAMGILEHIYETTKPFYRLIRSERARMQRERRAERRVKNRERPPTAPERPPRPEERKKMDDDAAEDEKSEIIDLYIKRLSAMNGHNPYNKQPNDSRLSLHPAMRSHIGFDAATGKYSRVNPDEVPHIPQIPPQHREIDGLRRSNTVISRDSRNDSGAYEVFRSDSPVSDDSRNDSPDRNRHRKKSKDDDQYSGSSYSRPSADQQPYDSAYQESSSILSPLDRDHELNLRMNPTNADIGGPRSPISPEIVKKKKKKKKGYRRDPPAADVQSNRQDAYSNLVGMPSAYEFANAQQKLKTLNELELDYEDEQKVEHKSLRKTKTDMYQNRSANTQASQGRQGNRGRTHDKRAATGTSRQEHDSKTEGRRQGEKIRDAHERGNTDWRDFCRLSLEVDKPGVPNQQGERRDNKEVELAKVKGNGRGKGKENTDPVQRNFMGAFRNK